MAIIACSNRAFATFFAERFLKAAMPVRPRHLPTALEDAEQLASCGNWVNSSALALGSGGEAPTPGFAAVCFSASCP